MKKISFFFLFLLIGFIIVTSIYGKEKEFVWPKIKSIKVDYHFIDHKYTSAKFQIMGINGKPLYQLECYLNAYEHENRDFYYSGDFECRLSKLIAPYEYSTLLTEEKHPTRDWQSRGRFFGKN